MKRKEIHILKVTKVRDRMKKLFVVLMMTVTCATVPMGGQTQDSYQAVLAAAKENSLSSIVPTFQIKSRSGKSATLLIDNISSAAYYRIYRSSSEHGTYSYVGTTSNEKYIDTGLNATKSYYYKIKAVNGNTTSKYSKSIKVNGTLGKVKQFKGYYTGTGVTMNWSSVKDATKYKVYRSNTKDGDFEYIGSSKQPSYTDSTVKAGTTYYYRVRAMKTVSKVTYNGVYSSKLAIQCTNKPATGNGSGSQTNENYVAEVLRLVNIERKKVGLSELGTGTALNNAAHLRATEIKSVFSHTRPDGSSCFTALGEFNINYRTAGENIAYGQKTPSEVVTGWMNSEGHRANILNSSFGNIGIGCYYSNGTYYWTQLFTN